MISFLADWHDYKLPEKGTYLQNHFNALNVMKHIKTKLQKVEHLTNNDESIEGKVYLCHISYKSVDNNIGEL